MKQLVYIHGGETFDTYDAYLDALRSWKYEPEQAQRWKNVLAERLGEDWQVFMPTMPSKFNAKYLEWSIWFEKIIPHVTDGVVLIGHSLGGIFLAKYLNEHVLPVSVRATFLIAAPFDTEDTDYTLADFVLPQSLSGLARSGGEIFLYHSEDDPVVPIAALKKYQALLPDATVHVFSDLGHFAQAEFPELIKDIKSLV